MAPILPESPSKTAEFLPIRHPPSHSAAAHPAEVGRQVFRGLRQSIPSSEGTQEYPSGESDESLIDEIRVLDRGIRSMGDRSE